MTTAQSQIVDLSPDHVRANLSTAELVERVLEEGEGHLASNGAVVVFTGKRTGRSPKDKFLEDTPSITDNIWWGQVNLPCTPEQFEKVRALAIEHLNERDHVYAFEGFAGADPAHRVGVRVVSSLAWHALFAETLFIKPGSRSDAGDGSWKHDWTVLSAGTRAVSPEERAELGFEGDSEVVVVQSIEKKTVVILGSQYAGEIKKSIFYALNYDLPDHDILPMHCSANVATNDDDNVALFFGLSGTGKTTLSADPDRDLIGDDEHGWGPSGIFNFEGGCYAKCIGLTREKEPQIWDAIRFGSTLENMHFVEGTRDPDYNDVSVTENTRVTYPVDHIPHARIPSIGRHPKNVIFLTADANGVLPPVSRLSPEQAMYYFINGYTSKLAGTEQGVKEPQPNFSPCFGGPFMPRYPTTYARMLAERIKKHNAKVWLLNTGWTGGAYGTGHRFDLTYTRAMVTAILDGSLADAECTPDDIFGLAIPHRVPGVPTEVLRPRDTWADKEAYDTAARGLAAKFRENDKRFPKMPDEVRAAGPRA
ncbi:MAG: phosphoenolpyruvate carboxykinase (ATP) [Phycisphaerales bacterium JB040]